MDKEQARGGCLCGRVGFRITLPSSWCGHCHCTMCQAAHGAAFVTWVGLPSTRFELTAGGEHLRWYQSSDHARRGFCSHCGSTMFFQYVGRAAETYVALGAIRDPIDREPEAHIYFDTHVDFLSFEDGLERRP